MLRLQSKSFDWSLQHVIKHGDTDIFPRPFEYLAIENSWDLIKNHLVSQDISKWCVRPPRRCLSPKHRYGFRIATQLDPLDFLIYVALVYEIGSDLEKRRLSLDNNCVFSYRFSPSSDGSFFNTDINYKAFQNQCRVLAESNKYPYVVVADIADFYPRLYIHRLENALNEATKKKNHVLGIIRLLDQLNENYSYGIPVGPSPSRLLAEVAIDDIDRTLLSESTTFARFVDDYRIFCGSLADAYQKLALLAQTLFENHGLGLQQHKTKILTCDKYIEKYLSSNETTELTRLSAKFHDVTDRLGLVNSYDDIDYDSLTRKEKTLIDSLNLEDLLEEQLNLDEMDISLTKFILNRLSQIDDTTAIDIIFQNLDGMYPIITDVAKYLRTIKGLNAKTRQQLGSRILAIISDNETAVSNLDFHRMWLLSVFSCGNKWGNDDKLVALYNKTGDEFSRRKLLLAFGHCQQAQWFRARKRDVFGFAPWQRRAFIAAACCLPTDEKKHWLHSLEPRLDTLEKTIAKWARGKTHPI